MTDEKIAQILKRIEELKANPTADLSSDEDLALAVMNLISLEEHFVFTGNKTNESNYYDLANEVRELRKVYLAKLLPETEGETWCAVKHLLAAAMRLIEVGQKKLTAGDKTEAEKMFKDAYRLYAMVWALKLKLADVKSLVKDEAPPSVEDLLGKLANCCEE